MKHTKKKDMLRAESGEDAGVVLNKQERHDKAKDNTAVRSSAWSSDETTHSADPAW